MVPVMSSFEDVGVTIHVLRVVRGFSQGDLAQLSGVRNSSISNYERGKSIPKLETLQKLAQGLDLPLAAMEDTQEFIRRIQARSQGSGRGLFPAEVPDLTEPAELDRLTEEAGQVATRLLRAVFRILEARGETQEDPDGSAGEPGDEA